MRRDNVALSRRITGGGAVYHDLGNTCFSFLTPYQIEDPLNYKSVNEKILLKALKELGVEAEASGRNDLTYHQKKVLHFDIIDFGVCLQAEYREHEDWQRS